MNLLALPHRRDLGRGRMNLGTPNIDSGVENQAPMKSTPRFSD